MNDQNSFLVFSGTSSRYLAEKICKSLGCPLGKLLITRFSDGEFSVSYEETVRGRDLFLVQSTFPNADNFMELLLMIDAAKRASARCINAKSEHRRQTGGRHTECGWYRPRDHHGPPC